MLNFLKSMFVEKLPYCYSESVHSCGTCKSHLATDKVLLNLQTIHYMVRRDLTLKLL